MSMSKIVALTDLETTGDVPGAHEIIEIGLVLFDRETFEIIDELDVKVIPEHIETAVPAALKHNGYEPEKWKDAIPLREAMSLYAEKVKSAVFCAYNVSFDWGFINEAFYRLDMQNPMSTKENHDRLDLLTMAWMKGNTDKTSLKNACLVFGIPPEPEPHTAFNGAMTEYKLFRKLHENI